MVTLLKDIVDVSSLEKGLADGYINQRHHPDFPELSIFNYSEKAQWENYWTPTIRQCRGLIYNKATGAVLARPFAKFFNYGQDETIQVDLDTKPYFVSDKFDGSLGIAYRTPDGEIAIATRGSFSSEQAIHATALIRSEPLYLSSIERLMDGGTKTPLFEIVYPDNRIVLDYGDVDKLYPIGRIDIATGDYIPWEGDGVFSFETVADVISSPPRDNAEGYVLWLDPTTAIKFKQEDYLAQHKIVTGLNRKTVWRALADDTFEELAKSLPDEFFKWADDVANEIGTAFNALKDSVTTFAIGLPDFPTRKGLALYVIQYAPKDIQGLVFAYIDGKDIDEKIWKMLEPVGGEK